MFHEIFYVQCSVKYSMFHEMFYVPCSMECSKECSMFHVQFSMECSKECFMFHTPCFIECSMEFSMFSRMFYVPLFQRSSGSKGIDVERREIRAKVSDYNGQFINACSMFQVPGSKFQVPCSRECSLFCVLGNVQWNVPCSMVHKILH